MLVSHLSFWLIFAEVVMSLLSDVPSLEDEPTAFLGDLDDVCMSLPVDDSMHAMQLRTPHRAAAASAPSFGSPLSSDGGSPRALQTPAKRLRLRQKTTPPPAESSVASPVLFGSPGPEEFVSRRVFNAMNDKLRYNYAYDKIRNFFCWRLMPGTFASDAERDIWNNKGNREKQLDARMAFKNLGQQDRLECVHKWLLNSGPPEWVKVFVEQRFLTEHSGVSGKGKAHRVTGLLLTWNLPVDAPSPTSELSLSLPPEKLPLQQLVQHLRAEPVAQALFKRIEEHGMKMRMSIGAEDVAMSLEVCPETWTESSILRLHIHMFFKSSAEWLKFRPSPFFDFEGSSCVYSRDITSLSSGSLARSKASWSGFFYCCLMDKKGTVFTLATKAPFSKFLVAPSWIMSLVQADKLSIKAARELLVRCVSASRHVKELEQYEMELEKDAVKEAMAEAQILLSRQLKKQKLYEQVQAFMSQFDVAQHRYKFLVLSGPSRVGKTAFARTLCEKGKETLEINCASGVEPNLRAYRLRVHGLILFDEIVASQVAQQRKLFQAQSAPVQLGCSATNCHSYEVFVWRTKLVLASNNWHSSLATLSVEDQEWINLNSIVLDVEDVMWEV